MGLLKHVLLPLFASLHGISVYLFMTKGAVGIYVMAKGFARDGVTSNDDLTDMEQHMIAVMVGSQFALMINCVAGIFLENSHYRGMAVLLELIFFVCDSWDYYRHDKDGKIVYGMTLLTLIGLLVHAKEPGIFTKDKNVTSKTKSKKK